jgi:DNA-binding transcriptional ArsR family regulator
VAGRAHGGRLYTLFGTIGILKEIARSFCTFPLQSYYAIMEAQGERTVAQVDSARLRALAHPVRARLMGILRLDGPSTATALAQRLGTNSGKTSYHLRQLAEVGLVEEDTERGNARERWWRAAHEATSWSSVDFRGDPDDHAADSWLIGFHARLHARWLQDWLDTRDEWSDEWIHASDMSDFRVHLTPARLKAMDEELHAVIERYRQYEHEENAVRVTVTLHAFPNPEPSV